MTTLISVTNEGGGNYTLTFSDPISFFGGDTESSILLYSPSEGGWITITTIEKSGPNSVLANEANFDSDCTRCVILDQPSTFDSVSTIQIATPQVNVT